METSELDDVLAFWRRAFRPGTREARWVATAAELSALVQRLGRQPRSGDLGVAPRMLSGVKNQRRADLQLAQIATLNEIPGWTWAPHDDAWGCHAASIGQFIEREGRAPRLRSKDAEERALGLWAARQRRAADAGRMPYERLVRWRELTRE